MATHYFKVGLGILIAIAILVTGYRLVQEFKLTKRNSYNLYVVFDNVQGLSAGNAVWLSGVKIGKVDSITLMPDGKAELTLKIENKYKILKGSQFSIKVGFLEDKILSIEKPGKVAPPYKYIKPGTRIVKTRAPVTIPDLVEQANIALGQINVILARARALTENDQIQQNIIGITENVRKTTEEIMVFAKMIRETGADNRENIDSIIANVDRLTENLIGTSQKLDEILANVNDIVGDPQMKQDIKDTVAGLKESVENIKETVQSIRDLATDKQVQDDLKGTIKSTKATMENADVAVSSFTKMIRAINETEIKPDFEFRYEHGADDFFADMNLRIFPPSSDVYYLFGFDDLGESSSTNLQFGVKGPLPDSWYRVGIKSGKLGLGFEYQKKEIFYEGELVDPNDLQFNLRVGRGITENTFVITGWEGAFKRDALSIGVLQRY